jgi:exonuclease V
MKQGSAVHQDLEDQVYTTVKVDIETREDAFGLRIWNIIQGLRSLQEIGMTRELEVWGIIEGQVVNGVIDVLSITCPDEALERELESSTRGKKGKSPADQTTLTDFYKSSKGKLIPGPSHVERQTTSPTVYICDVKTRRISSPPRGAAFRPTKIQLMIYHRLLSELATNEVDLSTILNRYTLDGNASFSDSFITQIGNLDNGNDIDCLDDTVPDSSQGSNSPQAPSSSLPHSRQSNQDSLSLILEHNSISRLWALMIREFRRAFPAGKASVGNLLHAEYRSSVDGALLGSNVFPIDDAVLDMYLAHAMKWWRGEREPEGVVVEEAYKCRSCEFADSCEWRLQRAALGSLQQAWGRTKKSFE